VKPILLVDDEPLVARLHARAITAAGFESHVAHDGEMALEMMDDLRPALIITDMNMPSMSGVVFASLARDQGFSRPIILLSGDDHVQLLIEGLRAGVDDFLVKGTAFVTISTLLCHWCAGPYMRLPDHIRRQALDYFDMAWPLGPPIAQLRSPLPVLESRAAATLKDLLLHVPVGFGTQPVEQLRLLGAAHGILTTLTRSDPLARLRLPDILARVLEPTPATHALLPNLDTLFLDATFQHAHQTLRLL
jgi:CheY-like chemotaxis protein